MKRWEQLILTYEEVLLEVLCFDFDIIHPHAFVADILRTYEVEDPELIATGLDTALIECVWSVVHDTYRTPLCVLFSPRIVACAAAIYGQCLAEGPSSPTVDDRLRDSPGSDLPWRSSLNLTENDLPSVAGELYLIVWASSLTLRSGNCNSLPILWGTERQKSPPLRSQSLQRSKTSC